MINCIAIDDEPLALVVLGEFCATHDDLNLMRTFTSTTEAAKFLKNFPVDLLFLDIQMPMNGLEFYRTHGDEKPVIFTTAFSEYAVEGFNVAAVDYLVKPIEKARFDQAVQRVRDLVKGQQKTAGGPAPLFVRSEYRLVRIDTSRILYIETMDDYLKIHLENEPKPVLTKMNLKTVLEKLDAEEFVRIHRSYVVPVRRVTSLRNRRVEVAGVALPVGDRYESAFRARYTRPD